MAHFYQNYGNLSLSLEANYGQTDLRVKYLARGSGYTLFLTQEEAVLVLRAVKPEECTANELTGMELPLPEQVETSVLRLTLEGGNQQPQVEGLEELPGKANYFIGNDPAKWYTNVPTYARVKYREVYPGVDMVYYGNQRQLEWDFEVSPGADPTAITLDFQGVEQMEEGGRGDLVLYCSGHGIRLQKPFIYQEVDGARREVAGSYVIKDGSRVGFQLGEYDASKSLVIDPVLIYSTFLGGTGTDLGQDIAVDFFGNAYVTGFTTSLDFPTLNPLQPTIGGGLDVFVTKINPFGSALVYSTYLGGTATDSGLGIAVDFFGNAYVTGITNSANFPTLNPLQPASGGGFDAFVAKINPFGSALVYSTFLGGSGADFANGIAVDFFGNAYLAGSTNSANFPTQNPLQPASGGGFDAFVAKIDVIGSALIYSTFLGGGGDDFGNGITVDFFGNAYVTGSTSSANFPTQNALQLALNGPSDAFITKINPFGSALVYSTYLGGSGSEVSNDIALDFLGNAYVTGRTSSLNFPTVFALQPAFGGGILDAFVTKINVFGSALVYSTYLGGAGNDEGIDITVDFSGNAYVTGSTNSLNFPTLFAFQPTFGGGLFDAFVTKINPFGFALLDSTYLGGTGTDIGRGIAVDFLGNAYTTGQTDSANFPTLSALQPTIGGGQDAFVTKTFSFF